MKLVEGFDSNYRYVLVAARRARQLQNGAQPVVPDPFPQTLPHRRGRDPGRHGEVDSASDRRRLRWRPPAKCWTASSAAKPTTRERPGNQEGFTDMPGLQQRLDEFKKAFEAGAPPYNAPHDAIETMHRATAELKASGIEDRALKVGDQCSRLQPCLTRIMCRWPRRNSSAKGLWLSVSSGDTGDLIATWSWRLYRRSSPTSEHLVGAL